MHIPNIGGQPAQDLTYASNLEHTESRNTPSPEGLRVGEDLNLSDCAALASLPERPQERGNFNLPHFPNIGMDLAQDLTYASNLEHTESRNTPSLEGLRVGGDLNLSDCAALASLPERPQERGNFNLPHFPNIGMDLAHDLTYTSNLQHTESRKVISAEKLYCLTNIEELPHQILIKGSVKIDPSNFRSLALLRSKDVEIAGSFTCEDICLSKLLDTEMGDADQEILYSWFHKLKVKGNVHFTNLSAPFALANTLEVGENLSIKSCAKPIVLPQVLNIGKNITLSNCMGLTSLSEELDVKGNLDISRCTNLTSFPKSLKVGGYLDARELTHLTSLPEELWVGGDCNLFMCSAVTHLPENFTVGASLNLASCRALTALPKGFKVGGSLSLLGCKNLISLPQDLKIKGFLNLSGCTDITSLPEGLQVEGTLNLSGCTGITSLPGGLQVGGNLNLSHCTGFTSLPEELIGRNALRSLLEGAQVRRILDLSHCTNLTSLPEGLTVWHHLNLSGCIGLTSLPKGFKIEGCLDLSHCTGLTSFPEGFEVQGDLNLSGCTGFTSLPEGLQVEGDLNLSGCTGLISLPEGLRVGGILNLSNCTSLISLPEGLQVGENLNLSGCTALTALPNSMRLKGNLNLEGCRSLTSLPNWIVTLGMRSRSQRTVNLTGTGLSPAVLSRLQERTRDMRGVQFYFSQEALEEYVIDFTELLPALEFWQECTEEESFINIKELSKELHHRLTETQDKKNLLSFLTRLTGTADYHNATTRPYLAKRILQIMQRMSEDEEVCHHTAFLIHQGLSSCDDLVMATLNDIMIDQMRRALEHPSITAEELKTAGKGFFFMEKLDEKIKICISKLNFIDEVEVYMAFHTRLQKMLNLPIHMKNMLFRRCVAISDEAIDSIGRDVLQHATEAEFEVFLSTWSPWKRYQRRVSVIAWELLPTLDRKLTATDICPYLQDKPERPVIYNNVLYDYDAFIKRYIDEGIDLYRAQVQMDKLFRPQSS